MANKKNKQIKSASFSSPYLGYYVPVESENKSNNLWETIESLVMFFILTPLLLLIIKGWIWLFKYVWNL